MSLSSKSRCLSPWTQVAVGLSYLTLVAYLFPREELVWDEVGFLLTSRSYFFGDYSHFLYTPFLTTLRVGLDPLGVPPDITGRLFSAILSTGGFLLLARFLGRFNGLSPWRSVGVAGLFFTTPIVLQQSARVEVYGGALCFLLLAANGACQVRAGGGKWARLMFYLGWILSCSFHFTGVLALPWLLFLACPRKRDVPRHALLLFLVGGAGCGAVGLVFGFSTLLGFLRRVLSFFPDPENARASFTFLGSCVTQLSVFFSTGAPVFFLLAGFSVLLCLAWLRQRKKSLVPFALLSGPYLVTYLIAGTSMLGLLLPVLCSLTFPLAVGSRIVALRYGARRSIGWILALALMMQVFLSVRELKEEALQPDQVLSDVRLIAEHVPEGAVVLAAERAGHLEWYTQVVPISLPNLMQHARAETRDLSAVLLFAARQAGQTSGGRGVFLTTRALDYLKEKWEIDANEILQLDDPIVLREKPFFGLVRIQLESGEN